jgi:hypothetical protein
MKKIILSAVAVFAFGFTNAQNNNVGSEGFAKEDLFITGSVSFGSGNVGSTGEKTNNFTFSPSVGYFATEKIAIGVGLNIGTSTSEVSSVSTKTNNFGINAFGRYYFTPASKFSLFGHASVGFGSAKVDSFKTNSFNLGIAPGINYFLSENFALETTWGVLSYNSEKADVDGAKAANNFNLGVNLSDIKLGLVYKF